MNFIITQQQLIDITNLMADIPTKLGLPVIDILRSLKPVELETKEQET